MTDIVWQHDGFGISVKKDEKGQFWIVTSAKTPPAFRKKPYVAEGSYANEGEAIEDAKQLVEHCRLGAFFVRGPDA